MHYYDHKGSYNLLGITPDKIVTLVDVPIFVSLICGDLNVMP